MTKIQGCRVKVQWSKSDRDSTKLQVSNVSISLDMEYLHRQAKESIREYVTEHLSEQYQVCLIARERALNNLLV